MTVTYREAFDLVIATKNPTAVDEYSSFRQQTRSSPLGFDSVKKNFPPRKDSNSFGTLNYNSHIYKKIDHSINQVFKSMTIQELNTLHQICEQQRTQLLTI